MTVVGLVPAGGRATRLGPLPCSKEIYPVGWDTAAGGPRPKVAGHYLLERLRIGGAAHAYVVVGNGKWDIPAYFADGALVDLPLSYLVVTDSPSTPHTIDVAYPFLGNALVAFGFPDVLFEPSDAFGQLLRRQRETSAAVVVGVFPSDQPEQADAVEIDADSKVRRVVIKQPGTTPRDVWLIAVWSPEFTEFLHRFLAGGPDPSGDELYVGHVLQAAIDAGIPVESVRFPGGRYVDIGTPESLRLLAAGEDRGAPS